MRWPASPGKGIDGRSVLCYICSMSTLNLRNVPLELRNQFKAACAAKGETMTEAVIEFMQKEVEKGKPRK